MWLKALVKATVLPPAGPLLIALAGIAMMPRHPRRGRALAVIGILALAMLSTPIVGAMLTRALDRTPPLDLAQASAAQAIVILGGGLRDYAPEFGGVTLNTLSLERVRYGARIARATNLPVLVSGGSVAQRPPEALLMRTALAQEFGVPVRWIEAHSRDTHENAVESARILKADGVSRVILVVHSFDVPRVRAEFAEQGIEGIAAPTHLPSPMPSRFGDFLPTADGLQSSYYALYEMLAVALLHLTR
ncbi:MAG TPA: YdcF family protein [Casimicrobiaceae bacterium]